MNKYSKAMYKRWKDPEYKKLRSKRVSESWKNKTTHEIKTRAAKQSRTMKALWKDPEYRKKMKHRGINESKRQKKLWADPDYRKKKLKVARDPKRCTKIGETNLKQYASGQRRPPNGTYKSCKHGWVKTIKSGNVYFNSSWEQAFIQILDNSKIVTKFVKEPFPIPYKFEGKCHSYYPDFYIKLSDGRKCIVELKALVTPKDKAKFRYAEKWCKENDYEWAVIYEKPFGKITTLLQ